MKLNPMHLLFSTLGLSFLSSATQAASTPSDRLLAANIIGLPYSNIESHLPFYSEEPIDNWTVAIDEEGLIKAVYNTDGIFRAEVTALTKLPAGSQEALKKYLDYTKDAKAHMNLPSLYLYDEEENTRLEAEFYLDDKDVIRGYVTRENGTDLPANLHIYDAQNCDPMKGLYLGCPELPTRTGQFLVKEEDSYQVWVMGQSLASLLKQTLHPKVRIDVLKNQQIAASNAAAEAARKREQQRATQKERQASLQADLLQIARNAIRVDGNLYFPPPKVIDVPDQIYSTEMFQIPRGLKTPVVKVFLDGSQKFFYSLEHLRHANPPVTWNGKQLIVKEGPITVTQTLTPSAKPAYSLANLKQAEANRNAAQDRLVAARTDIENRLVELASSIAPAGWADMVTLQYAMIPKGNNGVILVVQVQDNVPANWKACSVILPAGTIAYEAASMNGAPYFRISGSGRSGGQIVYYYKGAKLMGTNFADMPRCVY
ncbi:hypothetical protein [Deinococcus sp. RM]|uniref:hypothetical protein n=1 Tax=Deinococcus sp. RM TaxID=2316359 RepID=UPI0011C22865|nr:hypothetical protein [Deinococcus sp. RM]